MFFELTQVIKIQSNLQNLTQLKQKLDHLFLSSFSSSPNKIQSTLKKTLQSVLSQTQNTLKVINQIQDQVEMGYFVPSTLDLDLLVDDPSQLPEWFEFVFNKEYEKQNKNLNALCKKAYKTHSLSEVILCQHLGKKKSLKRNSLFSSFSLKEKTSLNIMGEAEILISKSKCSRDQFNSFCKSIAIKIVTFLEQSISKSMNFSNSMNSVGQTVTNTFNVKLHPEPFQRGYIRNKFRQTGTSFHSDHQGQKLIRTGNIQQKTIHGHFRNDINRFPNSFDRTTNQWGRYVPRYTNQSSLYDFYR